MLRLALALSLSLLLAAPAAASSVDGMAIHSSVQGSGKTIIFVHGWTCDESGWAAQVAAFDHDYRVITLDLPGHGKSDAPADGKFSMALFARAIEAVRAEVGADKVVLVGHSMGAPVIRQYALDYPQHVAGLVAVDGPLDVRSLANFPGAAEPMTLATRTALIEGMFGPGATPAMRAEIKGIMLGTPEATANGAGLAMFDPAIQSNTPITAPAFTVYASKPTFAPGDAKDLLPNWNWIQFKDTGHFVMMERPAEFNAALKTFLEQRARY
jgi:pimeloyl-ACP methyl ester carboxylesterase